MKVEPIVKEIHYKIGPVLIRTKRIVVGHRYISTVDPYEFEVLPPGEDTRPVVHDYLPQIFNWVAIIATTIGGALLITMIAAWLLGY